MSGEHTHGSVTHAKLLSQFENEKQKWTVFIELRSFKKLQSNSIETLKAHRAVQPKLRHYQTQLFNKEPKLKLFPCISCVPLRILLSNSKVLTRNGALTELCTLAGVEESFISSNVNALVRYDSSN